MSEEAYFSTTIDGVKPQQPGTVVATYRTRDGWRSTTMLPSFVGNKAIEKGDAIALVYSGYQIVAVEIRGVVIRLPFPRLR